MRYVRRFGSGGMFRMMVLHLRIFVLIVLLFHVLLVLLLFQLVLILR